MPVLGVRIPGGGEPYWRRALMGFGVAGTALLLALVVLHAGQSHTHRADLLLIGVALAFIALAVGNLRRLLLFALVIDIPLQWDVNLDYHDAAANLGAFGGINLSVTTFALAGLYAMWFAERLSRQGAATRLRFRPALPLIVYVGITAFSALVAQDRTLSFFEVVLLAQTLLLFVYIVSSFQSRRDVTYLFGALVASLAIESFLIIIIHAGFRLHALGLSSQTLSGSLAGPAQEQFRSGGTIGPPNTAGAFLALLLAPTMAMLTTPVSRGLKRLGVLAIALGIVALILTFSRGGWISFVVSMVIMSYVGWRRGWFRARVPVMIAVGILAVAVPFAGSIGNRLNRNDAGAAHSRVPLMRLASHMIKDRPLLGVGANNFALAIPDYAGPDFDRQFVYTVHNKYLLVWSESGIGALLAFFWFLGSTLRRGVAVARAGDPLLSPLAIGIGAAIAGHMVHMTVEIFQGRPGTELLWLLSGLLTAMLLMTRESAAVLPRRGPLGVYSAPARRTSSRGIAS